MKKFYWAEKLSDGTFSNMSDGTPFLWLNKPAFTDDEVVQVVLEEVAEPSIEAPPAKVRYIIHELTSFEREAFERAKLTLNSGKDLSRELASSMVDIVDRFTARPAGNC